MSYFYFAKLFCGQESSLIFITWRGRGGGDNEVGPGGAQWAQMGGQAAIFDIEQYNGTDILSSLNDL